MKSEKKIELQSKIINEKNKRISELEIEVNNLGSDLEHIEYRNSDGYKKAKSLIVELEFLKSEYVTIIDDLKDSQEKYQSLIRDMILKKKQFESEFKDVLKKTKKDLKIVNLFKSKK